MHVEQNEWRQGRVLTGRVKTLRHTAHVRDELSSSLSFLRLSIEGETAREDEDDAFVDAFFVKGVGCESVSRPLRF